jgi:hypothetical protein
MKLMVPYIGELTSVDARLIRLAEFLGISCQPLPLSKSAGKDWESLGRAIPDRASCLVLNPRVIGDWLGVENFSSKLSSFSLLRFSHVLVHAPRSEAFDTKLVAALSHNQLGPVQGIGRSRQNYEISPDARDECEAFAGLSFGPANPENDSVFSISGQESTVRPLISIGGRPFMAAVKRNEGTVLFLASADILELTAEFGDTPLPEYFSRFLPHAMALRYIFGDACWRPRERHASVIVDDPLLRRNYGFLNFESLLHSMKEHHFHTTVAFIPHNFGRNSRRTTRLFRENVDHLSLCFHGNDHTGAEFASTDTTLLNTMLQCAEQRMSVHRGKTGLDCDRVMVFPQGQFSEEAMSVLKARNFDAAVNTVPHPRQRPLRLSLCEIAQPAVLRYGDFPLFLRKSSGKSQTYDIAFNLFFGKPILLVEHHDTFQHPDCLIETVSRVNAMAPEVRWSNLARVVSNSVSWRRGADGTCDVRAYSRTVRIANHSSSVERFRVEWSHAAPEALVEQVLQDGSPYPGFETDGSAPRVSIEMAPGTSQTFSFFQRNDYATLDGLGFRWSARAFVRRRLSEVRDNYLAKSPLILETAKTIQRRLSRAASAQ